MIKIDWRLGEKEYYLMNLFKCHGFNQLICSTKYFELFTLCTTIHIDRCVLVLTGDNSLHSHILDVKRCLLFFFSFSFLFSFFFSFQQFGFSSVSVVVVVVASFASIWFQAYTYISTYTQTYTEPKKKELLGKCNFLFFVFLFSLREQERG